MTCFFFQPFFSSENANKQRCITSFSLLWNNRASLLINDDIHLFFYPSSPPSALPCPSMKHKGCACMETVINLFPIALPMTPFSAVRLGTHWTLGHDWSEDIPQPPGAVYANSCRFDREEVSCGICGFCDGWTLSSSPSTTDSLSYKKIDNCRQLKPRLSFRACVCWWRLLIVCVFGPGAERLWGGTRAFIYVLGSAHSQRDEGLKHMLPKNHRAVNSWVRLIRCAVFCGFIYFRVCLQPALMCVNRQLNQFLTLLFICLWFWKG